MRNASFGRPPGRLPARRSRSTTAQMASHRTPKARLPGPSGDGRRRDGALGPAGPGRTGRGRPLPAWPARRRRSRRRGERKWRSRPISRVLSWTVIPLGAASPRRSSNLPGPDAGNVMRSLFGLAPGGVCRAGPLPDSRCALTAPFHPCRPAEAVLGGIFLLHFPSARAAQALPGTVPCGARTFLGTAPPEWNDDATVWPTPPRALSHERPRPVRARRCQTRARLRASAPPRTSRRMAPCSAPFVFSCPPPASPRH